LTKRTGRSNRARQAVKGNQPSSPQNARQSPLESKAEFARKFAARKDEKLLEAAALEKVPAAQWAEESPELSLAQAFDVLDSRRAFYEACARAANESKRVADALSESVIRDREALERELAQVTEATAVVDERDRALDEERAALRARDEDLIARESEARAGFEAMAAEARRTQERELAAAQEEFLTRQVAERAEARDRQEEQDREAEERRESRFADIRAADRELTEQRAELDRREQQLHLDRGALRGRELALTEQESALEAESEARAAATTAVANRRVHLARVEAEETKKLVQDLSEQLGRAQGALLKLGTSDPAAMLDQLDRVRADNAELRNQLAARLADDDLVRLRELEARNRDLTQERERLTYELERLRGAVLANTTSNIRVRSLEGAQRDFEVISRGYEARIAELEGRYDALLRDAPDPTAPLFPRCVAMDDDIDLASAGGALSDAPDLGELTRSLQTTMFHNSSRAYRLNDIAVFLGGMAMSRLHLLEGMSGIGKTSLPKALAAALHTDCAVVEVQAGWRDRTDLFGHHNTFDKQFVESDFLQALYRATTLRYRDMPYFIVLDEMNLSRPEQYFSVVLSKLENDDGKPIQLVSSSTGRAPAQFANGIGLVLPDNVWFIGTANQDESTLEFANKTYNRAHLMELPPTRPRVPSNGDLTQPHTMKALRGAFTNAWTRHKAETEKVINLITGLHDELWEHARVQMTPRVKKQLKAFAPVVIAAAAGERPDENVDYGDADQDSVAVAADHFLAYKVLHSVRGRYDVTLERVDLLREVVTEHWAGAGMAGTPSRCYHLLEEERRRREG
jgi:hypothetical protein